MRTVTATKLRARPGEILDAASAGERIIIERAHRPVAILVPYQGATTMEADKQDRIARSLQAFDRLDKLRQRTAHIGLHYPNVPDAVTLIRQERSRDDP